MNKRTYSILATVLLAASSANAVDVNATAAGYAHSLYLKTDGSLWATGSNFAGQLGDGTNTSRVTPVQVVDANVSTVAAGSSHSLYLKTDGSLRAMGSVKSADLVSTIEQAYVAETAADVTDP